jgi:glycosyltransferase involved in cell wall biosynthesis
MRILYVSNERLNKKGGTPLRNGEIADELTKLGHKVYYMAPRFGFTKPEGKWNIPLLLIPVPPRCNFSFGLYEILSPLIVFFTVLFLRIDVVFNTATVSSAIQYKLCKLLRRRYVVEVNGVCDVEVETRGFGRFVKFVYKTMYKWVWRCADYYICVSSGIKEELTSRWAPFGDRSVAIPNAVNEKKFYPMDKVMCRKKLDLPEDKFIIGFVGLLCPWHGVGDLVKATKILVDEGNKNFVTLIVGGGDMEEELKKMIKDLSIQDYVQMTGRISHELVPCYNSAFDLACQVHNDPVLGNLGNSMKVWEYLASGCALVVSDMSEACKRVGPGLIGWKFTGADPNDLALKIRYAMEHPEECEIIGKANREYVMNGYRWKDIALKTESILKGIEIESEK